ncbi:hypothetical protein PCH_Pc03g00050 [Penicillium rubens Wisconsin 54-1255]|uniref:Uncharacterized protein n=1 Tax=Penicillium rubens (strain ATCC 28089 / DSM 1075 / NRRL 1951 / Wisconsin 54-1255) TaxID=500485 RepID=B6GVQ4_PENRW|nr:hypothetical protein PCH_Pc03g00050 [Penicillium rubens Wisconsin 54-1255]
MSASNVDYFTREHAIPTTVISDGAELRPLLFECPLFFLVNCLVYIQADSRSFPWNNDRKFQISLVGAAGSWIGSIGGTRKGRQQEKGEGRMLCSLSSQLSGEGSLISEDCVFSVTRST